MLLLYEWAGWGWRRSLRWQSAPYVEISGAFGSFFQYAVVPGVVPQKIVVAHGTPACRPSFSTFKIDVLEKKKAAIDSDLKYKLEQYNKNMPCDEGMSDNDVAVLVFHELSRDRDKLDVEIAEKRLALYDLQAGAVTADVNGAVVCG